MKPLDDEKISIRYATTLSTQFLNMALSVLTAGLVPRALGPVDFGNYNFILKMATSIRSFTDFGARHWFFTRSSKNAQTGSLTKFYLLFLLVQLGLSLALTAGAYVSGKQGWIWPQQRMSWVLRITVLDWCLGLALVLQGLGDSKGRTVYTQIIMAGVMTAESLGIILLAFAGRLNLSSYVYWLYAMTLLLCAALSFYLTAWHGPSCWAGSLQTQFKEHLQSLRRFSQPFFILGIWSAAMNGLDAYLIQRFYGSKEQAYFALSSRFSSFVLVFTSSALMIYWREIANRLASGNVTSAAEIYIRFNRVLFFLTACLSFWLTFNAGVIVRLWAGDVYEAAIPALAVMAFYPLQQTFGQLNSTVFLAAERTALYRNYDILLSFPSLLATYFLLAPRTLHIPGLGLGAVGLALKMAGYGMISIQAYEAANARFFNIPYSRLLIHKMKVFGVVGGLACLSFYGLGALQPRQGASAPLLSLGYLTLNSLIYFSLIGSLLLLRPALLGLNQTDTETAFNLLRNALKRS